ncbi:MAG: hypothetical protein U1A78_21390 [Polyangia bacterium]
MTSKPASSRAPLDADFEEDTLLPPPAPGLLPPTADHGFDPPTLPGLGSKAVARAEADEAAVPVPTHDVPLSWPSGAPTDGAADGAAVADPADDGVAPVAIPERFERTLRMPLLPPLVRAAAAPAQPKESGAAIALPPPPEVVLSVTPAVPNEVAREATRPMLLSPKLSAAEETLPPLPPVPARETVLSHIGYAATVLRSLYRRRQLTRKLHGEIGDLLREYERGLVQLGQRAFADSLDPLTADPRLHGDWEDAPVAAAPPRPTETVLRRDAERAAARYQALAQKELSGREQRAAGLASELRSHSKRRRQIRASHLALQARARGLPGVHPLAQQLRQAESELAAIEGALGVLAQRLGAERAEVQLRRRAQRHSLGPRLPLALSSRLCALSGQAPHLLVLGAIVANMRPGTSASASASGERGEVYGRLYGQLERIQAELASRYGLVAKLDSDLLTYDQEAVRRTVGAAVLVLAALVALLAAIWVLKT